ncbi:MAG TPA: siderophore-interacting protein [Pseudonocardia sp.]
MAQLVEFARLHVTGTELITPRMMRIRLGGPALAGFRSVAPDQQAKFFFAKPGQDLPDVPSIGADGDVMSWFQAYRAMPERRRPWMRSYSIRRHHPDRQEIDVDFVLHGHGDDSAPGPATRWARRAEEGDPIGMLGPAAAHHLVVRPHDWRLLVGDESALPAIGALLEAEPTVPTQVFVEVTDVSDELPLPGAQVHWVHRGTAGLLETVRAARLPAGDGFAWVAGEASEVRAIRRHLVGERGLDRKRVAFRGYWRRHLTQDDDPTAEDAADRTEVMAELAAR